MWELTQSADGAAVGLVAQCVCAGVAETQVSAGQDERVAHVRQTHHTLGAVVADLVVGHLERGTKENFVAARDVWPDDLFYRSLTSAVMEAKRSSQKTLVKFSPLILGCCICSRCRRSPAADNSLHPPGERERERGNR